MKAGLKSDSLAPLHYFSVVHESIAWSSCSSAELASSLIHEAKLTLSSLNLLLLKTKTLHFVLESTIFYPLPTQNEQPKPQPRLLIFSITAILKSMIMALVSVIAMMAASLA